MKTWQEIRKIDSTNENVSKFVFSNETSVAEAVLYKYPTYKERTVICCSTMSGCPVGCRFCGAGDIFVRSLSTDEIVSQVHHLVSETGLSSGEIEKLQIMFMSMGEPMLNTLHLFPAILHLAKIYPHSKLLISTSGPKVDYNALAYLSVRCPQVGLQFSVHESTDEARDQLIPYKRKLDLSEIARTGEMWHSATGRKPFFNYCVHDKNDSAEDARRIFLLFNPKVWEATISVICERDEHIAAANERQRSLAMAFMEKLNYYGYSTRMFDPAGQDDIGGGCGQLWFVQDWMAKHPDLAHHSVGHGKSKVHTPREEEKQSLMHSLPTE